MRVCDLSIARPVDASNRSLLSLKPCGYDTLTIRGPRAIYYAPELIAHYIDEHEYRPPDDFVTAVLECPAFRWAEYFVALLEIVGPRLRRRSSAQLARSGLASNGSGTAGGPQCSATALREHSCGAGSIDGRVNGASRRRLS